MNMFAENDFVRTTLIHGEPDLCKTLLFEAAISWAKDGEQVYYFASKQLQSLPLALHDRSEPSAEALKLITFISVSDYEELAEQLVKLPEFRKPPTVLLVDDLDVFASYPGARGCSRDVHVARCCALLLNTASFCAAVKDCPVQMCAATFDDSDYAKIYRRYFDNLWNLSTEIGDSSAEEGRRVWLKRDNHSRTLEFLRLDDAVLVLRRILIPGANSTPCST